jgi:hypothetical protein
MVRTHRRVARKPRESDHVIAHPSGGLSDARPCAPTVNLRHRTELRDAIDGLGVLERQEGLALMWLGRGDYDAESWPTRPGQRVRLALMRLQP